MTSIPLFSHSHIHLEKLQSELFPVVHVQSAEQVEAGRATAKQEAVASKSVGIVSAWMLLASLSDLAQKSSDLWGFKSVFVKAPPTSKRC